MNGDILCIYYLFVGTEIGTPKPMPQDMKTEQMDSPLAQHLDKPNWTLLMPQFSVNMEAAEAFRCCRFSQNTCLRFLLDLLLDK